MSLALHRQLRAAGLETLDPGLFAKDFGNTGERRPLAAVRAGNEDEIAAALNVGRSLRIPVTVRGAGHSSNGQTLSDGMVLVLVARGERTVEPTTDGAFRVFAGARWLRVEKALNEHGWACPVLTDYLDLSVGGTLSVGGYGVRSIARGAQVDHVRRIRLVLPSGERRWCSPTESSQLFDFALAGWTPIGVISDVELIPARLPPACEFYSVAHSNWRELAEILGQMGASEGLPFASFFAVQEPGDARPRSVWGLDRDVTVGRWPLHGALASSALIARELARDSRFATHLKREHLLARFSRHQKLWLDFVCEAARFPELAASIDRNGPDLDSAWRYALAIRKHRNGRLFPFEAAPGARDAFYVGLGIYFFVEPSDASALRLARERLSETLEVCLGLGGRPYRYGACPPWIRGPEATYGRAPAELEVLRRSLDSDGIFHPSGESGSVVTEQVT